MQFNTALGFALCGAGMILGILDNRYITFAIRQYLVENNFVETVISLAPNLFYGTTIAVNILVLSKHKTDTKVQFIDASGVDFFKKASIQEM
jgi:type I restriction-modification system DNA methylase subunit